MPELAEVEYFRKRWNPGVGQIIERVAVHPKARVFREIADLEAMVAALVGQRLAWSLAHGKQMMFGIAALTADGPTAPTTGWLGVHLGMAGSLSATTPALVPGKHDHLVLYTATAALVFNDPRLFGAIDWTPGPNPPDWWAQRPPGVLDAAFDLPALRAWLTRHGRAPLKAVLLQQERFPGLGNWMVDEILWRARLHPARLAGTLKLKEVQELFARIQEVARDALREMGEHNGDAPADWLFNHRWRDGGTCPKTGQPLARAPIGGRTTCWSPAWQKAPRGWRPPTEPVAD